MTHINHLYFPIPLCPKRMRNVVVVKGDRLVSAVRSGLVERHRAHDPLTADLWAEFTERRLPRVRAVAEVPVRLGQWLLDGVQGHVLGPMSRTAQLLSKPA
jgi:hypothetical protein